MSCVNLSAKHQRRNLLDDKGQPRKIYSVDERMRQRKHPNTTETRNLIKKSMHESFQRIFKMLKWHFIVENFSHVFSFMVYSL